jgi:hypothetical protein
MYCTVIRSVLSGLEVVFLFYCNINIDGSLVGFDAEAVNYIILEARPQIFPRCIMYIFQMEECSSQAIWTSAI